MERFVGRAVIAAMVPLFLLALVAGCGDEEGPTYAKVRGKVTLNGKTVQSGTVQFVPLDSSEKGGVANGIISRDGTYEIIGVRGQGVVIGKHRVLVQCPMAVSGPSSGANPQKGLPPCNIPEKYGTEKTSDIIEEVKEGENKIDIKLVGSKRSRR